MARNLLNKLPHRRYFHKQRDSNRNYFLNFIQMVQLMLLKILFQPGPILHLPIMLFHTRILFFGLIPTIDFKYNFVRTLQEYMQELLASQVKYTWTKIQGSKLTVISLIALDWKQDWGWLKKIQDSTRMKQFKRQRNRFKCAWTYSNA